MITKMKSYIKPFEKELALLELKEKTDSGNIKSIEGGLYSVQANVSEERLREDLAYWESVGETELKYTVQIELESTYGGKEAVLMDAPFQEEFRVRQGRVLRYGVHDIHEYRGKFFPQLVRACINISGIKKGAIVLDPFCGSGTSVCEAKISGMRGIGIDLNPLSVLIARVKANILEYSKRDIFYAYETVKGLLKDEAGGDLERWTAADLNYLSGWFSKEALKEIAQALCAIEQIDDRNLQDFLKLNLSNILRNVSWQKESDLRVRKEFKEYQPKDVQRKFLSEAKRQITRVSPYLDALSQRKMGSSFVMEGNSVSFSNANSALLGQCDTLITSPPYATSLPYLDTDRLSLIALGLMHRNEFGKRNLEMVGNREVSEKRRKELWDVYMKRRDELTCSITDLIDKIAEENHKPQVGFRRRNLPALLAKYFLDMKDSMKMADAMLKPGATAFYIVGSNSTNCAGKKVAIETNRLLWELSERVGWSQERYINMDMPLSRDLFKRNQGASEAVLMFKKGK